VYVRRYQTGSFRYMSEPATSNLAQWFSFNLPKGKNPFPKAPPSIKRRQPCNEKGWM
jgi:hypothetical protein